jgi:hypothetical protein
MMYITNTVNNFIERHMSMKLSISLNAFVQTTLQLLYIEMTVKRS